MKSYLIKPELEADYPVVSRAAGSYLYDQSGKNTSMAHPAR